MTYIQTKHTLTHLTYMTVMHQTIPFEVRRRQTQWMTSHTKDVRDDLGLSNSTLTPLLNLIRITEPVKLETLGFSVSHYGLFKRLYIYIYEMFVLYLSQSSTFV